MSFEQILEEKLNALIDLLSNPVVAQHKASCPYTVGMWADIWLETYKKPNIKPLTYEKYSTINKKYICPLFGAYKLNELDEVFVQRRLCDIPLPRQRQHIYAQMFQMLDKAVKMHLIEYNPMKSVELPKHKKQAGVALTREQEKIFVEQAKCSNYCYFYLFCLYAGLRRGECLALTRADIDFDNRTISISKSYNNKKVQSTKTDAGVRTVPIFDTLLPIALTFKNLSPDDRLFPFDESTVGKHMRKIVASCNFDNGDKITIHTLRHTFITRLYENSIDTKTIAKWCGHTDDRLTLSVYTHINPDFEQEQITNFNKGVYVEYDKLK